MANTAPPDGITAKCYSCAGTGEVFSDYGFSICSDCRGSGESRRFYHGTSADLQAGDVLVPGNGVGKSNFPTMDNAWGVWMSRTPILAGTYGPRVYEVEPLDAVTDWCAENGWQRTAENDEYVTSKARIVERIR